MARWTPAPAAGGGGGFPSAIMYSNSSDDQDITLTAEDNGAVVILTSEPQNPGNYHKVTLPDPADGLIFGVIAYCNATSDNIRIYGTIVCHDIDTTTYIYDDVNTAGGRIAITLVGSTDAAKWYAINETRVLFYDEDLNLRHTRWNAEPISP